MLGVDSRPKTLSHVSWAEDVNDVPYTPPHVNPKNAPQAMDKDTPDAWASRNPSLYRLTGAHPVNAELPVDVARAFDRVHPQDVMYVRSHGLAGAVEPSAYTLTITNRANQETVFNLSDLKSMPPQRFMVFWACAGNRRMELNTMKKTRGFNYTCMGWSMGIYKGAPLCELLKKSGVTLTPGKNQWLEFEGYDQLPYGPYETCLPLERCLDPEMDMMMAYELNDESLTADHGQPVRLVAPGILGGRWVKWVKNIRIIDEECNDKYYHKYDNKVLPPYVDEKTADLDAYFLNPAFSIWEAPLQSFIITPTHDSTVPLGGAKQSIVPLKGAAYTGGGRMITRVELSLDGAKTWRQCNVFYPAPPRHGKYFWCAAHWEPQVPIDANELHAKSVDEICLRAFDSSLKGQPERPTWNLLGHCNNCWYRIKVKSVLVQGVPSFRFQHPVGQQSNGDMSKNTGWMVSNEVEKAKL